MFEQIDKKILTVLRRKFCLSCVINYNWFVTRNKTYRRGEVQTRLLSYRHNLE